ncbi:family 4 carbohydrate esterase [Xylaria sp. CBS 124048]|nr:family 4 carbohydrate esterase [Xylaria sp. CBS 124048]
MYYSADMDAVAGRPGSYGGEGSVSDIIIQSGRSRESGLRICTRQALKLFEEYNIKTSWSVSRHSLDTFPEKCTIIWDADQKNMGDMTFEQHTDVLHKTWKQSTEFCGKPPRGHKKGTELFSCGVEYDHSLTAQARTKPLLSGQETGLVKIARSRYIDDMLPDLKFRAQDEFIFPVIIHPDVSGWPRVLQTHKRIVEHIKIHDWVE